MQSVVEINESMSFVGSGDGVLCVHRDSIVAVRQLVKDVEELRRRNSNQAQTINAQIKANEELERLHENQRDAIVMYQTTAKTKDETHAVKVEGLERQVEGWIDSACHFHKGQEFYHGLIIRCGKALGPKARLCSDGTYSHSVLALNVPELVEAMCAPQNRFLRGLRIMFTGK